MWIPWRGRWGLREGKQSGDTEPYEYDETTPEELMGTGYRKLQNDLASEYYIRIISSSSTTFGSNKRISSGNNTHCR